MSDMWDDLEEDARASSLHRGPQCSVHAMLHEIGDEYGAAAVESVMRTLANHRLTSTSIHKALESRIRPDDLPSVYTLQRHRTGRCSCPREAS